MLSRVKFVFRYEIKTNRFAIVRVDRIWNVIIAQRQYYLINIIIDRLKQLSSLRYGILYEIIIKSFVQDTYTKNYITCNKSIIIIRESAAAAAARRRTREKKTNKPIISWNLGTDKYYEITYGLLNRVYDDDDDVSKHNWFCVYHVVINDWPAEFRMVTYIREQINFKRFRRETRATRWPDTHASARAARFDGFRYCDYLIIPDYCVQRTGSSLLW